MRTFNDALKLFSVQYDFNKHIGPLAKAAIVSKLSERFNSPKLKIELGRCSNLQQMANTIQQMTGELTKERPAEQIKEFNQQFERLAKLARL